MEKCKLILVAEVLFMLHHVSAKSFNRYHRNDKSIFDAIEWINRKVYKNKELFEGDIMFPFRKTHQVRNRRNIDETKKWDTTNIPYYINADMTSVGKTAIRNAIKKLSEISCIKLIEHGIWSIQQQESYIIFKFGVGCYSQYVGQNVGEQEISIGRGCEKTGIVIHEILHALGFWHVQSRTDRDQFVSIHYENIESGKEGNFGMHLGTTTLEHDYDLKSIMHYGPFAFSKNGKETITPIDSTKTLFDNNELSSTDISQINTLYCDGLLPTTTYTKTTTTTLPTKSTTTATVPTTTTSASTDVSMASVTATVPQTFTTKILTSMSTLPTTETITIASKTSALTSSKKVTTTTTTMSAATTTPKKVTSTTSDATTSTTMMTDLATTIDTRKTKISTTPAIKETTTASHTTEVTMPIASTTTTTAATTETKTTPATTTTSTTTTSTTTTTGTSCIDTWNGPQCTYAYQHNWCTYLTVKVTYCCRTCSL